MMGEDEEKYSWFDKTNELRRIAEKSKTPLIGTFELTARCNLACEMCYIRHDARDQQVIMQEKTAKEWIDLGVQAANAGTLFLLITGGEPLLRPDFKKIYEALNKMGFITTIYTNATLITPEFARWIAKIPPNKVSITLYGASPETYKAVTGSAEAFEKTLHGIELLMKADIKLEIRSTIIKTNRHEIDAMRKIAKDRNLEFAHTMLISKPVRGGVSVAEKVRLSPPEMVHMDMYEKPSASECLPEYNQTAINILEGEDPLYCAAGKCSYWMAWNGKMLACSLMGTIYSMPFETNFIDAWEKLKISIEQITSPEKCSSCKYRGFCPVCPGRLEAETGSFNQLSPYVCDCAELLYKKHHQERD